MDKITKPKVSVIILNLNGQDYLKNCLDSLLEQTYDDYEIIIVDNGSKDHSLEILKENYSKVRLIENKINHGFAEANNQGFEISKGEFIITLNNDTIVDKNWIKELAVAAEKNEIIGMVASKILLTEEDNKIDSVGLSITLDGMTKQRGWLETDNGQYDKEEEILFPSACAALYKRKMLEEVGFFDEDFFAYCEDSDLGIRARLAGWKAVVAPNAVVRHLYSRTGGKYSPMKAYLVERNHFWLVIKNFPLVFVILLPFFTIYRYILQLFSIFFKKGATSSFLKESSVWDGVVIILKANLDTFVKIPELIKKRKKIKKLKKIKTAYFFKLIKQFRLGFGELVFKS